MEDLITQSQIESNLRRTASEGLISLLSHKQLNALALKYYGVYYEGKLVGYECPYSGEKLLDADNIVLEHIIPVSSGGGTVLFNCIPTSKKVNGSDEKGAQHLLSWWKQKEYYNCDKLDKLLSYMFEAYDTVFLEYSVEEVENSYYDINLENKKISDLSTTSKEQSKKIKKQVECTGIITYLGFINDCILELKNNGYDVTKYQKKLEEYEQSNVFKEIEKYCLIQESLRKVIKSKLDEDNRSELTYVLNVNIIRLMNSIDELKNSEQLINELLNRINNIESILLKNDISILSFFEDVKNQEILYKKDSEVNETDIANLINLINLCTNDKFEQMCKFAFDNMGNLPSAKSQGREKLLGAFKNSIQTIQNGNRFATKLNKKQLEYLHNSEYETLREIYKVILNKAIENNVEIEYVDIEMKNRILEFKNKNKDLSIEGQIQLEQEYKDSIIIKSQFNEFINFVINNNGNLPRCNIENEGKLGGFRFSIQTIQNSTRFDTGLNKKQLEYLHNSDYESLREIYKVILNKAIENNVEIEYVDIEMKNRILEFKNKNKDLSIEGQIQLEQEYKDSIIIKSQFNEFINFVINNNGDMPNTKSDIEKEKKLGNYKQKLISLNEFNVFNIMLSKQQLEYLHNSEYETLREIYKVILNKAIENNVEIEYVDIEMKNRILEFKEKNKNITLEEQIQLEQEYKDSIIIKSQFNEFINFVISNNGTLPRIKSKNDQEKKLGNFIHCAKVIRNGNSFHTKLDKKQLEYLHDSEYETLREIYKVILNKAIENNIELEYVDIQMKNRILEFKEKNKNITLEEQIQLEQEYKDSIIIKSQFNEFINFVINNNGNMPNKYSQNEEERRLGNFKKNIQTFGKKYKPLTLLAKEQLNYLYCSESEELRNIYNNIIAKSYENRFEEYIKIDSEIKNEVKNRRIA